jgi:glycosyltransferase involved in cell wall biosynthesis
MDRPALTIQLCTYKRAHLLGRVLRGCFEQTCRDYEVVLVNDGSPDNTDEVIAEAKAAAPIPFTAIDQANAGLARGRNVGIAHARGERIAFIDDDVLPMPNFVEEHLRTGLKRPGAIVRGAVIMTESLERLPQPLHTLKDYSGNFFWTSNVSVPLATLHRVGLFNESFKEYGWEDIELGLRLRIAGVRGSFNPRAIAFHYKPPLLAAGVEPMIAQARAQARTAVTLAVLHPHWRVALATGDPLRRALYHLRDRLSGSAHVREALAALPPDRLLTRREARAARALATAAYYDELTRARSCAA